MCIRDRFRIIIHPFRLSLLHPVHCQAAILPSCLKNMHQHRKMLIDTFINAIFLYDDKMVITFNYKDGTDTITFDDLKTALADKNTGSDLDCLTAPKCVDERCNTENVARKCDVFMYFPLLFHLKSCKKTSFSKPWYCPARGVIFEMHPAVFTVWCDSDTPASKKRRKICNRASLFSYRAEKRRFSFSVR